jgi:hypothetical protein
MIASHVDFLFFNANPFISSMLAHAPDSVFVDLLPGLSGVNMVGTAPAAKLYALKVFPSSGGGSPGSRIVAAVDRAITLRRNFDLGVPSVPVAGDGSENDPFVYDSLPIEVINMSFGGGTLFAGGNPGDLLSETALDAGIVPRDARSGRPARRTVLRVRGRHRLVSACASGRLGRPVPARPVDGSYRACERAAHSRQELHALPQSPDLSAEASWRGGGRRALSGDGHPPDALDTVVRPEVVDGA